MPYVVLEGFIGLSRLLQTLTGAVVEPAVHRTADATILDAPIGKRHQSVGAPQPKKTGLPLLVAEEDEILTEETDLLRLATGDELTRHRDRMPVPTHVLALRGSWPNVREQIVHFLREHLIPPREARLIGVILFANVKLSRSCSV
jgi:hypothetical protein